jgi:hypothetical protein
LLAVKCIVHIAIVGVVFIRRIFVVIVIVGGGRGVVVGSSGVGFVVLVTPTPTATTLQTDFQTQRYTISENTDSDS